MMNRKIGYEEYLSRQSTISAIAAAGIERLRKAKVAVIGAGGVGSAVADYLARMGVGHLRLVDQDIIEPTNLHRIHGASAEDLYLPKAEVLAKTLCVRHEWLDVEPIVETLRETNVDEILSGVDLLVDGLDNFRTRYILNRHSVKNHTPYIFSSSIARQGHLAVFAPPKTACLECAFPSIGEARIEESCERLGVTPTTTGLVGLLAADWAVQVLLGKDTSVSGKLLTIDLEGPDFLTSELVKKNGCHACDEQSVTSRREDSVVMLCGDKTASVMPGETAKDIDLSLAAQSVAKNSILARSGSVLVYRDGDLICSVFRTGRMIIQGVETVQEASEVAKKARKMMTNHHLVTTAA